MKHFPRACVLLAIGLAGVSVSGRGEAPSRAVDPGVRPGSASAGTPVAGVDAQFFANVRSAFNEVYSIAGDIESGAGLGPRFNGTSCGGCHAYPASGGSSPKHNPQLKMAAAHGATNTVPAFLKDDGPVRAVRVKSKTGSIAAGGVAPLFTVSGRTDAYRCAVDQPNVSDAAKLSFRIPTPVFGAGLIENMSDAAILANRRTQAARKRELGIGGRPHVGADGTVGKFGWKAQHHSLTRFAEEAYQTEMGVRVEGANYRRESLSKPCYALYEAAYDDPYYESSYDGGQASSVFLFTEFMRFLDAPAAAKEFRGASAESIGNGRRLFEQVGCALCHTPSLRTGGRSNLAALNGRDAPLYSDLLLHHMGARLTDGIVQGSAGADEFRTAPLWGAGQRVFFLHDGRTADLLEAIREHANDEGGLRSEANGVIERFGQLSAAEQQDVLNFLRSL